MATTTRLMTAEDLLYRPDDGLRHELIDGFLTTMPLNTATHGFVASNLGFALSLFVRAGQLGRVGSNGGFILSRDPDTVLGPDVAFLPTDRVPPFGEQTGYVHGCPELAAEILDPTDTVEEMQRKAHRYLNAGTRLVWIANPAVRSIEMHALGKTIRIVRDGEILDGGDVLPDFAIPVAEIFA